MSVEEIFTYVLHGVESVALSVLIWRTIVADKEREAMRGEISEASDYLRAVIDHLLRRTDVRD